VLSMAVGHWTETMDLDTNKAEAEHQAALLDIELEEFAQHVLGHTPQAINWMA
jgi:hypothetical protein